MIRYTLESGICVYYRWEKTITSVLTARGKAAATSVGPGFSEFEPATRYMEGDYIDHGQDGMNHKRRDWLVLTGVSDTVIKNRAGLC